MRQTWPTNQSSWTKPPTMQAQCCVGSGLLWISSVIILPSLVCSANHLPAEPATGCQPSSTVRGSWLMLTSPGGTTLGLLPSPSSCWSVSLALRTLSLLGVVSRCSHASWAGVAASASAYRKSPSKSVDDFGSSSALGSSESDMVDARAECQCVHKGGFLQPAPRAPVAVPRTSESLQMRVEQHS